MHYVPVSSWTMAKEGSKRVEICGMDDKRQITAVFGCNMLIFASTANIQGENRQMSSILSNWSFSKSLVE